jgi:hypothetical protein
MLTASVLKLNNEVSREASRAQLLRYGFERIEAVSAQNSEEVFSQDAHHSRTAFSPAGSEPFSAANRDRFVNQALMNADPARHVERREFGRLASSSISAAIEERLARLEARERHLEDREARIVELERGQGGPAASSARICAQLYMAMRAKLFGCAP